MAVFHLSNLVDSLGHVVFFHSVGNFIIPTDYFSEGWRKITNQSGFFRLAPADEDYEDMQRITNHCIWRQSKLSCPAGDPLDHLFGCPIFSGIESAKNAQLKAAKPCPAWTQWRKLLRPTLQGQDPSRPTRSSEKKVPSRFSLRKFLILASKMNQIQSLHGVFLR